VTPDDPRHGTVAGHIAHQRSDRNYCDPCIRAKAMYDKRRKWDALNGRGYTVPSLGARRRVQALRAAGWSRQRIAEAAGWETSGALRYIDRSDTITRTTHERVAEVYERLAMKPPPDEMAARRARTWARRQGHPQPLAWWDIDDPNEVPDSGSDPHGRNRDDLDPVVVDRLLAGEHVDSTRAERDEAMRRWRAAGRSERSLCELFGWHEGRYGRDAA
jgi:hypothetical protein